MPPPDASGGAKRLAVLGAGRWGRNCIRTVQSLPGVRLTALYSTNPDSRGLVDATVMIADDWRRLIDDFDGDGVIVATPPLHHAEIVERAAKRGLAVMVEKPLTLDLDEAIRLTRAVAAANVPVLVDHVHLFNPAYRKLKEMSAGLGPCRRIESQGGDTAGRRTSAPPLWDFGAHDVSLALDLLGSKAEVVSAKRALAGDGEVFTLRLGFPSAARADIVIGNGLAAKRRMFAAAFDKDVLVFDDLAPKRLVRHRRTDSDTVRHKRTDGDPARHARANVGNGALAASSDEGEAIAIDDTPPLSVAIQTFAAGIRGGARDGFGLDLGVAVVRVLSEAEALLARPRAGG
jgi:predicted dehydrogenase